MRTPLQVLLVEDSQPDAELILRELKKGGYQVQWERVMTRSAMVQALARQPWEIIICDNTLPQFSAMEAIAVLKSSGLDIPLIIISGTIEEEAAVTALKAGAHDFLSKGRLARLIPAIERELQDAEARRERRRTLEALRDSESRYRMLFESNPHPMWIYDLETLGFLAVNDAAVAHYGYFHDEFLSMTIKDIRPPEDVPALMANLAGDQQEFQISTLWRHQKKDGTRIDVEISSHSVEWMGRPARLVIANDITERKRAQERLRQSEQEFRSLAENIPDIVARFDDELRHVYISAHIEKITGIPASSFIGKTNHDLPAPKKQVALWDEHLNHVFESGKAKTIEFDFPSLDGLRYFESRLVPESGPTGKVEKVLSIARDITERIQTEEKLRRNEEVLRLFVEHAPAAIAMLDRDMRYIAASRRYIESYGLGEQNLVGRSHYEIFPEIPQRWREIHRRCLSGSVERAEDDPFPRGDGRLDWVRWEIHPWYEKEGEVGGIILFSEVVTERKQAQLRIQHLTRLYATLSQVNAIIIREKQQSILFQSICNVSVEHGKFALAWIGLLDRETGQVTPVAVQAAGQVQLPFNSINVKQAPFKYGLMASAVETGNITYSQDIQTSPAMQHWRETALLGGFHSAAAVPFRLDGEIVGLLNLYATDLDFFTDQEQHDLLAEMGLAISFALEGKEREKQRQAAEAALARSEKEFRSLADNALIGIFRTTTSGEILYANDSLAHTLEFDSPEELSQQSSIAYYANPAQRTALLVALQQNGQVTNFEVQILTKSNQVRDMLSSMSLDGNLLTGMLIDITDRKQAEERLKYSQQRLANIIESANIGTWEWNVQTGETIFNDRWAEIVGYTLDELSPVSIQTWLGLAHPDDLERSNEIMDRHFAGELSYYDFEARMKHKDGHWVWVHDRGRVISFTSDGRPEWMYGTRTPITERKLAEEELRRLNAELEERVAARTVELEKANTDLERALQVKDEFLANMSHELRTPLNAILGLSESLGEQIAGELNAKQQRYVNVISESGHHLLALINDILDLAKIESGQVTLNRTKVDVNVVCEASLRMVRQLANKKQQEISFEIDEHIDLIWADERRLKQMVVNLLSNAVKFTPQEGKIGLEVRGDPDNNEVRFTVWDTGIGIKQEDLTRLFRPFVQLDSDLARETPGTGLGLALVAQMARLHGGSVHASSEFGAGSRFTITLPWESPILSNTLSRMKITGKFQAVKPTEEGKRPTILLVEDTEAVIMLLRDYLEYVGYKVATARNGLDGIVEAHKLNPDLILMDVQMPGMNGLEATQKLKQEDDLKHIPIIALTALAMPNDRERCLAAGMDEYMSKPVNLKSLVKLIQKYI